MMQENFNEYSKSTGSGEGSEGEKSKESKEGKGSEGSKRHRHHYAHRDVDDSNVMFFEGTFDKQPYSKERHGGGRRERLERGTLRYLLLDALHHGSRHGYEIIKWLEEETHGRYAPSPGIVYPTLQLLQDRGCVRAEQDEERTIYSLTEQGQSELDAHKEIIKEFWTRYEPSHPSRCIQPEINFLHEEMHDLHRTVKNGGITVSQYDDRQALVSMRHALERCQKEIRDIIVESVSRQSRSTT